ncbi:MAG: hypothetical protein KJ893_07045, partial [Candidatus Omnitrophica bacterium]|nr:hypothetical protein [Candidatus Omnitrophota bacterium]MBU4477885.1 hypothetical protein [Candidatus Omnitrophota bacterium]MCG2704219.1 hypothetical protein [Candidatus Omnitrophota bacterium]
AYCACPDIFDPLNKNGPFLLSAGISENLRPKESLHFPKPQGCKLTEGRGTKDDSRGEVGRG